MKVAEEFIRALYAIRDAIKGNNGESGGRENTNDNGLYGADGIIVLADSKQEDSKVFISHKELFDDFKTNNQYYINNGSGRKISFLYTQNNIDKLLKPRDGALGKALLHINFLSEDILQNYQFVSIQNDFQESDVQKIVERLGNNVYVFEQID